MKASLTLDEARRLTLAAQLSPGALRKPRPNAGAIENLVDRLGLLQIDSVNVLSRSHYLPVFSRLGAYDRTILDDLTYSPKKRAFFEYWAHEASFLPFSLFPFLRWRMDDARKGIGIYASLGTFAREQAPYIERILEQIRQRGPVAVRHLEDPGKRLAGWWGWSPGKIALEYLFWTGQVTAATRRNFERHYDLAERAIPSHVYHSPPVPRADAIRHLMLLSARALGVATFGELRDYFRLPLADAKLALSQLIEDKSLEQVSVDGWRNPAFVPAGTRLPRSTPECHSLISPFDPLIWERTRTEQLFNFSYRIEIYTPASKRRHGYYVLPFLLRDRFTARLCLKADRKKSLLLVNSAHHEDGIDVSETADALKTELELLAGFLDLSGIRIARRGNLARALRRKAG